MFNCRNNIYPQVFVIPAQAGIQPDVITMSYAGLDPGLRRDDGDSRSTLQLGTLKSVTTFTAQSTAVH